MSYRDTYQSWLDSAVLSQEEKPAGRYCSADFSLSPSSVWPAAIHLPPPGGKAYRCV